MGSAPHRPTSAGAGTGRGGGRVVLRVVLGLVAFLGIHVVGAAPAHADSAVDTAADGLRDDRLYVHPATRDKLDLADRAEIATRLQTARSSIYVAVLPADAQDETWGDASRLPAALYEKVLRPGTYVVLVGNRLVASSTTLGLSAQHMAEEANQRSMGDPTLAVLGLVDEVDRAAVASRSDGPAGRPSGPQGFPWGLTLVAGLGGAVYLLVRRKRDRMGAELVVVSDVARDDLTALGDDLTAADPDTSFPGDPAPGRPRPGDETGRPGSGQGGVTEAATFHRRGLAAFDRANRALVGARGPEDLGAVSRAVAEGRFALSCARAAEAGVPLPPRRAPCFYDPSHGPSCADAEWAPPDGHARQVPVCPTCADRLGRGDTPEPRRVAVGRRRLPYWEAGPSYAPWARGYYEDYREYRLASLLQGTELGSALAGRPDGRA